MRGEEERRQRWCEKWKKGEWMAHVVTACSNLGKMQMVVRKSNSHLTYCTNAYVSKNKFPIKSIAKNRVFMNT